MHQYPGTFPGRGHSDFGFTGLKGMVESGTGGLRLPLGEDLVVGHVHAHGSADTEGSSLSPRIKRRIRAKTSLAEIERKERGRSAIPGPPRLRTLVKDAAEIPISEGSLVPASTPRSGPQRAHPYTPIGNAVGSSSFEMVPSARTRAASDRGFDDSVETVPIPRANSSPSIIQDPTQTNNCNFFTPIPSAPPPRLERPEAGSRRPFCQPFSAIFGVDLSLLTQGS